MRSPEGRDYWSKGVYREIVQGERSRPMDPGDVAQAVFQVLEHHIDPGEVEKVKHALPAKLRALCPEAGAHA